jgi:hypothetical protein
VSSTHKKAEALEKNPNCGMIGEDILFWRKFIYYKKFNERLFIINEFFYFLYAVGNKS